jgi:hypothetical protein
MRNLIRFAVLVFLAAQIPGAFAQAVGRIIASSGDVSVVRASAPQPGPVGTALQVGDLVRTGAQSNAQLWFADSSVVALRHASEFLIDQYSYRDNPANDRAFFRLLKGGLRTVTGAIGAVDRRGYQLVTPHASVGRRGTQFAVVACQNDCLEAGGAIAANGTYGGIFEGRIGVVNNAGEVQFGVGEFFFVADLNSIPRPLVGPPSFLADRLTGLGRGARASAEPVSTASSSAPVAASTTTEVPPPPVTTFSTTQDVTASGTPAVLGVGAPAAPGPGVTAFTGAWMAGGPGTPFPTIDPGGGTAFAPPLVMTVAGSGASQTLASVTGTLAQVAAGVILLPGESLGPITAVVGSLGTDMVGFEPVGNIHWGRWVNGSITGEESGLPVTETPTTGVHYIYGEATSETVIAAKTGSVTYSDIGGTTPTDNHGNQASSFSFGPINVNFTTRQGSVSAVTLSGAGSNFSFSNVPFAFQLRPGQGVGFAAEGSNVGTCTGACAGQPGGADIAFGGVFLGPTGNLLGTSWHLSPHTNSTVNPLMFTGVRLFKCPTCP